jgi:4-hydroxysphinganine ceramide fatty acyl 2-hydroxylase
MPPTLFFLLSFPVTRLAHALFPPAFTNGAISGAFVFCKHRAHFVVHDSDLGPVDVIYDSMHYAYATFRLHGCVFLTQLSFQHASHQTSGISPGAEKVSFSSSLQKLRAWFWCHQYGPPTYYCALSNV